ncbi:MAG: Succinate dehydrogenase iron-sulfur protein, partial [uncultured Nocardioidaceae bacterium]
ELRRDVPGVARGRLRRGSADVHGGGERGRGRPRRRPPVAGHPGRRPRRPLELQGRQVRLVQRGDQRPPAAAVHDPDEHVRRGGDGHRHPAAGVPGHPRPGHRRLLQLRAGGAHPGLRAAGPRRRRQPPHAAGGRRALPGVPQVHRVLALPGHLPRHPRPRGQQGRLLGSPLPDPARRAGHAPARRHRPAGRRAGRVRARLLQHHQVLQRGVPRGHPPHRQRDHPAEGAGGGPQVRPAHLPRRDDPPAAVEGL